MSAICQKLQAGSSKDPYAAAGPRLFCAQKTHVACTRPCNYCSCGVKCFASTSAASSPTAVRTSGRSPTHPPQRCSRQWQQQQHAEPANLVCRLGAGQGATEFQPAERVEQVQQRGCRRQRQQQHGSRQHRPVLASKRAARPSLPVHQVRSCVHVCVAKHSRWRICSFPGDRCIRVCEAAAGKLECGRLPIPAMGHTPPACHRRPQEPCNDGHERGQQCGSGSLRRHLQVGWASAWEPHPRCPCCNASAACGLPSGLHLGCLPATSATLVPFHAVSQMRSIPSTTQWTYFAFFLGTGERRCAGPGVIGRFAALSGPILQVISLACALAAASAWSGLEGILCLLRPTPTRPTTHSLLFTSARGALPGHGLLPLPAHDHPGTRQVCNDLLHRLW